MDLKGIGNNIHSYEYNYITTATNRKAPQIYRYPLHLTPQLTNYRWLRDCKMTMTVAAKVCVALVPEAFDRGNEGGVLGGGGPREEHLMIGLTQQLLQIGMCGSQERGP